VKIWRRLRAAKYTTAQFESFDHTWSASASSKELTLSRLSVEQTLSQLLSGSDVQTRDCECLGFGAGAKDTQTRQLQILIDRTPGHLNVLQPHKGLDDLLAPKNAFA